MNISSFLNLFRIKKIDIDLHLCQFDDDDFIDLYKATIIIVRKQRASLSVIQKEMNIGYNKAEVIIDNMELLELIGPFNGHTPRTIFLSEKLTDQEVYNYLKLKKQNYSRTSENEINDNIEELRTGLDEAKQLIVNIIDKYGLDKELLKQIYNSQKRVQIPENVKNEVWRRDEGKCINCGSRELLEFDHIIPVSKGGSNSVRNLQLLCQKCNRIKSDKIG